MKNSVLFVIIITVLQASCSTKTNEERAKDLIETDLKADLIKPESYEFAKIKLDSCFTNHTHNEEAACLVFEIAKTYKEYKKLKEEQDDSERHMALYAPDKYSSEYTMVEYKKHKGRYDLLSKRVDNLKNRILQEYKDHLDLITGFSTGQHEFNGWMVEFNYRAENSEGVMCMESVICYIDKDMTKITSMYTMRDLMEIYGMDLEEVSYEFADELKQLAKETQQ